MDWPRNSRIILDIRGADVWSRLTAKTRNCIQRGIKEQHWLSHDKKWWHVWYATMMDKGIQVDLSKALRLLGESFVEKDQSGKIIGGALVDLHQDPARYRLGFNTSQWLIWKIILECQRRGIPFLDLGQSRMGSGSYFFKTHIMKEYTEIISRASLWGMAKGWLSKRITLRTYYVYRKDPNC